MERWFIDKFQYFLSVSAGAIAHIQRNISTRPYNLVKFKTNATTLAMNQ